MKTRYEFREWELTERAFEVYSDSDFIFYKEGETFYFADNYNSQPNEIGKLEDVEEFLLQFAD